MPWIGRLLAICALALAGRSPVAATEVSPRSFTEPVSGLKFVLVPAGRFIMGSEYALNASEGDRKWFADEAPRHRVTISRAYWLATTETTVQAFRRFVDETGYITTAERKGESVGVYQITVDAAGHHGGGWAMAKGLSWRQTGFPIAEDGPVTHVSWEDASAFVTWLRDRTGRPYRLPTEAEWEYAAGGPQHTIYSWGDADPRTGNEANIADRSFGATFPQWRYPFAPLDDGAILTAPVARYLPNGFGLFDMTGNVWEWCADRYSADSYSTDEVNDPQGPSEGNDRVHRGGGFDWELAYLRVAKRRRGAPDMSAINIGFRVALGS